MFHVPFQDFLSPFHFTSELGFALPPSAFILNTYASCWWVHSESRDWKMIKMGTKTYPSFSSSSLLAPIQFSKQTLVLNPPSHLKFISSSSQIHSSTFFFSVLPSSFISLLLLFLEIKIVARLGIGTGLGLGFWWGRRVRDGRVFFVFHYFPEHF